MFTFKAMDRRVFDICFFFNKIKQDHREYTRITFTGKSAFCKPFFILSFQDYKGDIAYMIFLSMIL